MSIKGGVYFDGDGTPKPGEETAPFRLVILGSYDFRQRKQALSPSGRLCIAEEAVRRLSDPNY